MTRSSTYPRLWLAALLMLALWPLAAGAQLQSGNLYGTVTDEQGVVLPGVTATLSGIGAPQDQVTNAQGQFRFLGLSPGSYTAEFDLEGFSPIAYPRIAISIGRNTNLEVVMSAALSETITVTGEAPLLDERKLDQGAVVSSDELSRVPTARDPWSLLSQAPGVIVDRVNVGGNESGQQSDFIGLGSNPRDNVFAVDGVVLTDMNAVGASATYFDFGAFEEVQFTVSSADVTAATAGVTINQVTKRGTNEWRGVRPLPAHRRLLAGESGNAGRRRRRQRHRLGRRIRRRRRRAAQKRPALALGLLRRKRHPQPRRWRPARPHPARGPQLQAQLPAGRQQLAACSISGPTTS